MFKGLLGVLPGLSRGLDGGCRGLRPRVLPFLPLPVADGFVR